MPDTPTVFRSARRSVLAATLLLGVAACARPIMVDTPPKSVVFFTAFSADLDSSAQGVIRQFAQDAASVPTRAVIVQGYADSAGSTEANRMLSALRAQVVTDALVTQGVGRSRIVQRPRGPTSGDPGIESRRVELDLGN